MSSALYEVVTGETCLETWSLILESFVYLSQNNSIPWTYQKHMLISFPCISFHPLVWSYHFHQLCSCIVGIFDYKMRLEWLDVKRSRILMTNITTAGGLVTALKMAINSFHYRGHKYVGLLFNLERLELTPIFCRISTLPFDEKTPLTKHKYDAMCWTVF